MQENVGMEAARKAAEEAARKAAAAAIKNTVYHNLLEFSTNEQKLLSYFFMKISYIFCAPRPRYSFFLS